jgi:FkbM family methyltransferase
MNLARSAVVGTPLESTARRLWARTTGDRNVIYNFETYAIFDRVLGPQSTCIDIGCHTGEVLDEMLGRSPQGRFFAFEPLPHLFAGLQSRYRSDAIHLYPYALGNREGASTFQFVTTNPAYSGLKRRPYERDSEQIEEIKVEVRRLDDVIPTDASIDLIKIDVEGGEFGVLVGGSETIARSKPVVVFEHGEAALGYGTSYEQVFDFFADVGMKVSTMKSWLRGGKPFSRSGFVDHVSAGADWYFVAA